MYEYLKSAAKSSKFNSWKETNTKVIDKIEGIYEFMNYLFCVVKFYIIHFFSRSSERQIRGRSSRKKTN